MFPNNDENNAESVMLIQKNVRKHTRRGNFNSRTFIMSTHAVYLLEEKTDNLKAKCFFNEILAIIKAFKSKQFVLKFGDSRDDIRISTEDRDDIILSIIMRFANHCPDLNLKVYGIPQSDLSSYCTYDKAVIKAEMNKQNNQNH